MAGLDWLLSSRSSVLTVPGGVPRDALDTVARTMAAAGFRVVSDVAAAQSSDYRAVATTDRVVRFEPVKKPSRAEEVRSIAIRQKDDRALRVTVGFGRARGPQIAGAVMMILIACVAIAGRALWPLTEMLYYPLAMAIALLIMPGKVNADAVRGILASMELALESERTRAADSVRRRVEDSAPEAPAVRIAPAVPDEIAEADVEAQGAPPRAGRLR